eukprot:35677-Amorphochlora_amoeboformis.AAC.2
MAAATRPDCRVPCFQTIYVFAWVHQPGEIFDKVKPWSNSLVYTLYLDPTMRLLGRSAGAGLRCEAGSWSDVVNSHDAGQDFTGFG